VVSVGENAMKELHKRVWLLNNLELLLVESVYHRTHDDVEELDGSIIWRNNDAVRSAPE
jgi:hypothetical protein